MAGLEDTESRLPPPDEIEKDFHEPDSAEKTAVEIVRTSRMCKRPSAMPARFAIRLGLRIGLWL
jgi:hypothetical protein